MRMTADETRRATYIKGKDTWAIGLCDICTAITDVTNDHRHRLRWHDRDALRIIREHLADLQKALREYDEAADDRRPEDRRSYRRRHQTGRR